MRDTVSLINLSKTTHEGLIENTVAFINPKSKI